MFSSVATDFGSWTICAILANVLLITPIVKLLVIMSVMIALSKQERI